MADKVSNSDRDMMVRTMIGEADDQPDVGKAAVAHVIMNRINAGQWGPTPTDVVLSRGQFEPWQTRAKELMRISPKSERYQNMGKIADAVLAGQIPDPTNGSTHFLQPETVQKRYGKLPDWASGEGQKIGGHMFYKPSPGTTGGGGEIGMAAPQKVAQAVNPDEVFGEWGVGKSAKQATPAQPASEDVFKEWGINDAIASQPARTGQAPGAPQGWSEADMANWNKSQVPQPGSSATPDSDRPGIVGSAFNEAGQYAKDFGKGTASRVNQALATGARGVADLKNGMAMPRTPSLDPRTWEAGGLVNLVRGVGGTLWAPFGAAAEQAGNLAAKTTGNRQFGDVVENLAPIVPVGRAVNAARPVVQATNELVKAIGKENLPTVIKRLEENPKLSLMDVSPEVQTLAMRKAAETGPAQSILHNKYQERKSGAGGSVAQDTAASLGPPHAAYDTLNSIKSIAGENAKKFLNPIVEASGPADITNVISHIDKEIGGPRIINALKAGEKPPGPEMTLAQQKLWAIRQKLIGDWQGSNGKYFADVKSNNPQSPTGLHQKQSEIRAEASDLLSSATGSERSVGRTMMDVRNKLVDSIDEAVGKGANASPGHYKQGLKQFRDDKELEEAFNKGMSIRSQRGGEAGIMEDSPAAWRDWSKNATKEELSAAKLGALADLYQKLGSVRNAAATGSAIPQVEFAKEKYEILFGKDKAEKWAKLMSDQRDMARTNSLLFENSKTGRILAGEKGLQERKVKSMSENMQSGMVPVAAEIATMLGTGVPGLGTAGALGYGLVKREGQRIGQKLDIKRSSDFARLASQSGAGAERQSLLAMLRSQSSIGSGKKTLNLVTSAFKP